MAFGDTSSFFVGKLLMFLVMAMVAVDDVAELAKFVLQMNGADFGIVKGCGYCREEQESARVLYAIAGFWRDGE